MAPKNIILFLVFLALLPLSTVFAIEDTIFESFWSQNGGIVIRCSLSILAFMPFLILSRYFAESTKNEFSMVAVIFGLAVSVMLGFGLDNNSIEYVRIWLNLYSVYVLLAVAILISIFFIFAKRK